uniref:Si_0 protein n=1 Tax=Fopius arisanus TaxID=64838 RepID=A0A0C9QCU5_9HYME
MKPKLPPDNNDRSSHKFEAKLKDRILFLPVTKYVLPTFLLAALLLTGVYLTMRFLTISENHFNGTCEVPASYQVNCLPDRQTTYEECTKIECCFDAMTKKCYHTVPSRYGYTKDSLNPNFLQPKQKISPFGSENKPVAVYIEKIAAEHIRINMTALQQLQKNEHDLKVENTKHSENAFQNFSTYSTMTIEVEDDSDLESLFSVTLRRGSELVMTTSKGPLIVTETYWEWNLFLGNSTVYGLNSAELNGTLHWIYNNEEGMIIPGFLGITNDGKGIGCYVDYKGPMEIEVLQSNLIILRGISALENLSINIFSGETPQHVTERFLMFWRNDHTATSTSTNLGLHICPEKLTAIEDVNDMIEQMENRGITWDSYCIHRKFYDTLDRVLDQDELALLANIQRVLTLKRRTILHHVSNLCSYGRNSLASELGHLSLLLESVHGPYVGVYEKERVVYPNWFDKLTHQKYDTEIERYFQASSTSKFLYLRDLWAKDDSNVSMDFPKLDYIPKGLYKLMSKGSIPIDLFSSTDRFHYKVHNYFAREFQAFIGKHAQSTEVELWTEKSNSGWVALRKILNRGIASGLLGKMPSAIYMCSVSFPADDDLCQRWYGIGVAFPYLLAVPENIPGGGWLSDGTSKYIARLLSLRAKLTSYQHSTITEYYSRGAPILVPTYFHYSDDVSLKYIENQFMWGDSILVGAVTLPNTFQVQMHIPGALPWRHIQGGGEVQPTGGISTSISVLAGEIITLLRPGHIIPVHETPGLTSTETRLSVFKLICNLACVDGNCHAEGKIYYSRDAFLHISANDTSIVLKSVFAKIKECSDQTKVLISFMEILGHESITHINLNTSFCDVDVIISTGN